MQRKIHNQTLFVAALSVYFGLLIVGAPPQVLAQQSKTIVVPAVSVEKGFSADESGSSEVDALLASNFFVESLTGFLKDLETLSKIGKFSPDVPFGKPFRFNDKIFVDKRHGLRAIYGKESSDSNNWLATAFRDFEEKLIAAINKDSRLYIHRESLGFEGARQIVKVELTADTFTIETSFDAVSVEKAASLTDLYNAIFALGAKREDERKVFYESTKTSFENNQVFIVSRLPRAGLDALLKS